MPFSLFPVSNTAEDMSLISKRVCLEPVCSQCKEKNHFDSLKKILSFEVCQQSGDQLLQKVQLLRDSKHYEITVAIAMFFSLWCLQCLLNVFCY